MTPGTYWKELPTHCHPATTFLRLFVLSGLVHYRHSIVVVLYPIITTGFLSSSSPVLSVSPYCRCPVPFIVIWFSLLSSPSLVASPYRCCPVPFIVVVFSLPSSSSSSSVVFVASLSSSPFCQSFQHAASPHHHSGTHAK